MAKQLNVNLAFTADTSQASQQLSALQNQLRQLTSGFNSNSGTNMLTKDIKNASQAAVELQRNLQAAINVDTGKLDLSKLSREMANSGMSLEKYQEQLYSLGSAGEAAFGSLSKAIMNAEMPIRRSNGLLQEFKTTLMNTARWQISSSILHGFMGSIQSAIGYAQDLNQSLNNIRIVTGQNVDQMAAFAENANKAAKALSTSTLDYTNASLIYYQQGLNDKQVAERTQTTLKLANVSRQSAEEVSNQMTAIWNNFDDGSKKLEYYADVITALGAKTASSSSEIAQGLSKFAAIADTVGLSYEYASASIATVVAETRQSADTVGNAFKALFARLQSLKLGETLEDGVGLTKYTQALAAVGVQVLDINGNLRDADDILNDLGDKWQDISSAQKAALAQTVAGQRQYSQMIALMDNWDKVKANVGIAEQSGGTLQSQQDIYAESWEAASKRVKASLQSIYQDLLDDKFFIGFLNGLSSVLDGVDRFIDRIGGLKTVISSLGALATQIFAKDIAKGINGLVESIRFKSGKNADEAMQLKEKNAQVMSTLGQDSATQQGKAMGEVYSHMGQAQEQILKNQKHMSDEQLNYIQLLSDSVSKMGDEAIAAGKVADQLKAQTEEKRKDLIATSTNSGSWNKDQINAYTELNEAIGKTKQNVIDLNRAFSEGGNAENPLTLNYESVNNQIERLKNSIQEIQNNGQWDLMTDQEKSDLEQALAILEKIQGMTPNSEGYIVIDPTTMQQASAALETTETAIRRVGNAALNLASENEGASAATKDLGNSAQKTGAQMEETGEKVDRVTGATAGLIQQANKAGTASLNFGQKMALAASTALAAYNAVNNLSNVLNEIKMGNPAEAAITGFQSLIVMAPTVIMSINRIATATKLGGLAATGIFAGVTAAIALITWGLGEWKKAQERIYNQSAEGRFNRLVQASEAERDRLEELKEKANGVKDAFASYDEIVAVLDRCKTGTQEWKEALIGVSGSTAELIRNYPELLTLTIDGQQAVYKDAVTGMIKIREGAMEELERLYQQDVIKQEQAANYVEQQARQAEIDKVEEADLSGNSKAVKQAAESVGDLFVGSFWDSVFEKSYEAYTDEKNKWAGKTDKNDPHYGEAEQYYRPKADTPYFTVSSKDYEAATHTTEISKNQGNTDGYTDLESSKTSITKDLSYVGDVVGAAVKDSGLSIVQAIIDYQQSDRADKQDVLIDDIYRILTEEQNLSIQDTQGNDYTKDFIRSMVESNSDQFEAILNNNEATGTSIVDTLQQIFSLEESNRTQTAAENQAIASEIIANNATLMNSSNYEALLATGGEVFQAIINSQISDKLAEIEEGTSSYEDLFKEYAESKGIKNVDWDKSQVDDTGTMEFKDHEGNTIEGFEKVTAEAAAAYLSSSNAVDIFTEALINNSKRITELLGSKDEKNQIAGEYLSSGNFRNVKLTDLSNSENAITQENVNDFVARLFGMTVEGIETADISELDTKAQQIGADSFKDLTGKLISGWDDATKLVSGDNNLVDRLSQAGVQGKVLDNLTVGSGEALENVLNSLNMGPLGAEAGNEFIQGLDKAIAGRDSKQTQAIMDEFLKLDPSAWQDTESALTTIQSNLAEQGIQLDLTNGYWQGFIDKINSATYAINDFSAAKENFSQVVDILHNLSVGDSIKLEDFETLQSVFGDLSKFFLQTGPDSFKLVTDLSTTTLSSLTATISELKEAQSLYQEAKKAQVDFLEEGFADKFDLDSFGTEGDTNPYNQIAEQLGIGKERLIEVLSNDEELELLRTKMQEWYQAGANGMFDTSAFDEMLASLYKTEEELKQAYNNDLISFQAYRKQKLDISRNSSEQEKKDAKDAMEDIALIQAESEEEYKELMAAMEEALASSEELAGKEFDFSTPEGIHEFYDAMFTLDGEINITGESWSEFFKLVNGSTFSVPSLEGFTNDLTEISKIVSGKGLQVGDTLSSTGFETLTRILPDIKDGFIETADGTYMATAAIKDMDISTEKIVGTFKEYQEIQKNIAPIIAENIGNSTDLAAYVNSFSNINTDEIDAKTEELASSLQNILGALSPEQLEIVAPMLGKTVDELSDLSGLDLSELQYIGLNLDGFLDSILNGDYDVENFYNYIASTLTSTKQIQNLIDQLIASGADENNEYLKALYTRKAIVEALEEQKKEQEALNDLLKEAGDKDNHYDDERRGLYEDAKSKAQEKNASGELSDEDYISTLRTIGQGIAEIDAVTVHTRQDMQLAKDAIKEAFSDPNTGEIPTENIKAFNDAIIDLIANADGMTLAEKFAEINSFLDEQGISNVEYYKEVIIELFNTGEGTIHDSIRQLNQLLKDGTIDAQTYLGLMKELINSDSSLNAEQKAGWYNTNAEDQQHQIAAAQNAQAGDEDNVGIDFRAAVPQDLTAGTEAYDQTKDAIMDLAQAAQDGNEPLQGLFNTIGIEGPNAANILKEGLESGEYSVQQVAENIHQVFSEDWNVPVDVQQGVADLCESFKDLDDAIKNGTIDNVDIINEKLEELYDKALKDPDIDLDQWEDLSKTLKKIAEGTEDAGEAFQGLSKDIADDSKEAQKIASDILRYSKTVDKLEKSYDKWQDTLKDCQKDGKRLVSVNEDQAEVLDEVGNAMSDMLGMNMDGLSKDFLNNADNLELMKQAAEGSEEAYNELLEKAGQDVLAQVGIDTDRFYSDRDQIYNAIEEITGTPFDDIEIGASLDDAQVLQAMTDMVNAAGMTAAQATDYLASMGVDAEVIEEDTTAEEQHETMGWEGSTHPITGTVHVPGVAISSSEGGVAPQETAGIETDWTYDALDVTPQPEQETATKENKAFALKVVSANKSSGGGMKHSARQATSPSGGGGRGRGGGCFIAGTLISTPSGFERIENIAIEDIVLSYNEKKKRNEYSKVVQTMIHILNEPIYTLYIEDEKLEVTGIHRFYITRDNKTSWIPASELQVGDFVLFANGTLHKIDKITVDIRFIPVYNFEVSGNHNYYVGINQILAHNKGRGGGGRADRPRTRNVTKRAAQKVDSREEKERYHVLNNQLEDLEKQYDKISSAKDRAYGKSKLELMDAEIKKQEQIIAKQKEYLKEVEKNIKLDKEALKGGSKISKEAKALAKANYVTTSEKITKDKQGNKVVTTEEKNTSAAADSKSFLGIDAKFDANGTLTNYDQLIEAKVAKLNAAYAELAKYTDDDLKYRDQEEKESDADYKKWQKRHAAALEAQNAVARVEAQAAQWDKLLAQYEESQDLYWEKQNEILEAEYKRMSAMLEKDKYKLQIKIDIEDEGLERLEFLLGRIGDRAEKAAAAIANLGKQAKASADKSAAYEKSLIDFFGEKTNKMKVIGTDKDTGAKIYGNDESSGRLDGKAIVETLRKGGKEAEDLIKTLGKRPDFDEEWLEAISDSIRGMMEEAESMQEKVNDAFERMRDVYEEMQDRMDKVIDRQKKIKELSQGYLDVIDIIGRQRTGMTSEKEYDIQKKIYEQQRNIARAARTQLEATKAQKVEAQSGLDNAKKQVTQLEKLKKYAEDYQKSQKNTTKEIQEQAKAQSKAVKDNASSQKKAAQDMAKGELSAIEQKLKEYQKIEEKYSKQADENRLRAQDYKTLAKDASNKNKKAKSQKYTNKSNEFLALADSQDNQAKQAKNMVDSLTKQKQEIQAKLNKTITDIDASTNKQLDNIEKKAQKKIENNYNNSINKKAKSLGIQNWDEVVKHSQSAGEASVATPEEIQGMIDTWQEDVYKWQDTVDEIDTEILDQTREVQEEFTMTVEEAYKLFETGMQGIIRDFNSAVSGASGTIDALQHAFERYNQANSTYVEDYEKVYRLQKLNLGLQQDIDKASNPKAKRELLQLQEKINEAYESGNKLSEYQIQMMEKERDLLVAKAEFEDAQNAKSKVSLTRDNEGNVGYVYTADPTDVAAAEENYNAKIYEMRKLNAEYIEELQQQLMDLDAAYTADMENLYQNFEIGSEAYFTELARIQDNYKQSYQNVFDQFGVAIDDSKHINEDYVNTYVALTGDQKSADIEYIKSFDETTYSKLTGFTTMQEAHDAHVDAMQEAWGRANEYTDDFMENTKEDFEEAGYDINNYGDTAETEISKLGEESDLLKEKMEQIATETKELFSAAVEALKTMEKEMDDIIGKISTKCKTLGDAITAVKNKLAGFEEQISEGEKEPDKPRRTDDRRTGDRRTGDRRPSGRRGGGRGNRGRRTLSQKDKDGLALAIWNGNYGWSNDPVRHQRLVASGLTDQQAWDVQANVNRMGREGLVHSGAWYGHYSGITDFSKWRYGSWHLKSGGYTGQWSADENEGRWAVLHQKELVLNKEDTANMLSAVDILRQISSTINLNALAAAGGLSSGVSAGGVGTNSRDLNQHVEISASFPNATDRNEISAAFENLIGLASQYANR